MSGQPTNKFEYFVDDISTKIDLTWSKINSCYGGQTVLTDFTHVSAYAGKVFDHKVLSYGYFDQNKYGSVQQYLIEIRPDSYRRYHNIRFYPFTNGHEIFKINQTEITQFFMDEDFYLYEFTWDIFVGSLQRLVVNVAGRWTVVYFSNGEVNNYRDDLGLPPSLLEQRSRLLQKIKEQPVYWCVEPVAKYQELLDMCRFPQLCDAVMNLPQHP